MLGGIRGIRALRVQRDYMKDVQKEPTNNRFEKYEETKWIIWAYINI